MSSQQPRKPFSAYFVVSQDWRFSCVLAGLVSRVSCTWQLGCV